MNKTICFLAVIIVVMINGTLLDNDVKGNSSSYEVSVKIKKANKKSISFKIKNKTDNRIFSGPFGKLYIYKKKKWKNIVIYLPRTIPLERKEITIYKEKWRTLVDKKYLNKKKCLKRGKYKLKIYNKTFKLKIS